MWQTLLIDHCALCPFEHPSSSWDTPVQLLRTSIPAVGGLSARPDQEPPAVDQAAPTWFSFLCLRTGTEAQHLGRAALPGKIVYLIETLLSGTWGWLPYKRSIWRGCSCRGKTPALERLDVLHPEILRYSVSFQGICFIPDLRPEKCYHLQQQ